MSLERMLADALREEAESRDVDLPRLWVGTRDRLEQTPSRPHRRPAVLAAAAAAVVVVAGVVGLTQLGGPERAAPAGPAGDVVAKEGEVSDDFTCPEQVVHDWTRPETVVDKQFVASFRGGLDFQTRGYDVPRYTYRVDGDRAFVSFGSDDGSLAMRSEFHRQDGEWVRFRSEVCSGEDGSVVVPVDEPLELRNHLGGDPLPPSELSGRDPQLLDHRSYYTHVGVVRPRSLYAGVCGTGICLSSVEEDGDSSSTRVRPGVTPYDVSFTFLPNDAPYWRNQPYGMWALYDRDAKVEDVSLDLRDGRIIWATKHQGQDWPGTLYVLVAPFDEVGVVTVHHTAGSGPWAGEGRDYLPEDLAGHRPD